MSVDKHMRPSKSELFMAMAFLASQRGTCGRRKVGAVITSAEGHVLSTGYNGVASGQPHCTDQPCPAAKAVSGSRLDECYALHAEQNAVTQCSQIDRAHALYTTTMPCISCVKLLIATPIQHIIYYQEYPHTNQVMDIWTSLGRKIYGQTEIELKPDALIRAAHDMDGSRITPKTE